MPAPSKPAASIDWMSRISSGIGCVPGTRMWTRTGSLDTDAVCIADPPHRNRWWT